MDRESQRNGTSSKPSGAEQPKSGSHPPWMYINYMTDHDRSKPPAYRFPLAKSEDLQKAVEAAVKKIKSNPPPKPVPGSPDEIEWHYPSYLVFVLDSGTQKIDTVEIWLDGDPKSKEPFKTEHRLANFDTCTALYYTNLRKNKKGDPLAAETELYQWKAHHSRRMRGGADGPRTHENSGTNVGP